MRVLLDTHLLLWALGTPAKLPARAKQIIDSCEVYVSAASIWEISIKAALGKLTARSADVLAAVEPTGFSLLSITGGHAAHVSALPLHHRDPFDRLLIAQAVIEPMQLLTKDQVLAAYGAVVIVV